ncbi:hypothetical protein [Sedimentitalea nanhaiensis]|uniref:Uncharacterized protein n=1 Tax=Sedimentitalea nanhaiensis TaxID=999627 RepID=A0A1I7E1X6_9RHOB|nr:hypothetical protein [Sedimentitalea nanhaiensis]SFU17906.1 hypothetical protein SAMN05216236_14113 [Sedimentitalea nanhaiensis]
MSIEQTQAFQAENDRLADLANREAIERAAPHQDLVPQVWLSSQPDAGAELSFAPAETGFALRMDTAGRSPWVSLSWAIDFETLRDGRYVGVIAQVVSDGFFAIRPCLRLLRAAEFHDSFAAQHMASSGGAHLLQSHIPIPPDAMGDSHGAEIHLFFSGDAFSVRFDRLETVLMR